MRIEGECYFHMPPGALLKVISFALYKHVCITFQPTLVFKNKEYANMHFIHGFCNGKGRAVVVEYQQRSRRRIPHGKIFDNMHRTLKETGSFP
jgi:hypothetical protein